MDPENNGVNYMDIGPVITSDTYGHDGVYFNERGNEKLAQYIIRWLNASSMMMAIKRMRSVSGRESVEK